MLIISWSLRETRLAFNFDLEGFDSISRTWIEKCPSSSTSVFLLIIICFSSFVLGGGGKG